ncbi:recombination regulator RecX [Clostridium omnivorum]|uniref:Regulatory protein RecX n=1 Tax=Clostridium omnivorum TaxID=1604902 RepID=A0ABQ5NA18_9CLOT|nr:recombination regulator RecX [Clostridium sp. E14]GLC32112.1 regulatory protein RecX [Clostridium sp. E14]
MEKTITKIEVQKRNKNRVSVFLNHEYMFSCSSELVYSYKLKVGNKVDLEYLKELAQEDNFLCCKNDAMRVIEKSYKTEKEMYDKLINKGYDESVVKKTIEFLKSYSFVDDLKYTELYIKEKIRSQGNNKIKYSLLKKGIDEKLVKEKLSQVDSDIEYSVAETLAIKKYELIKKTEKDCRKQYKKLGDYLIRNGYDSEIVSSIVKKTVVNDNSNEDIHEKDSGEISLLAQKRLKVLMKSEQDQKKLYKKLADYLLRRGYRWEDVKSSLKELMDNVDFEE